MLTSHSNKCVLCTYHRQGRTSTDHWGTLCGSRRHQPAAPGHPAATAPTVPGSSASTRPTRRQWQEPGTPTNPANGVESHAERTKREKTPRTWARIASDSLPWDLTRRNTRPPHPYAPMHTVRTCSAPWMYLSNGTHTMSKLGTRPTAQAGTHPPNDKAPTPRPKIDTVPAIPASNSCSVCSSAHEVTALHHHGHTRKSGLPSRLTSKIARRNSTCRPGQAPI